MPDIASNRGPRQVILGCASQGTGSGDEARLRELLEAFQAHFVPFTRKQKLRSFKACLQQLRQGDFDLFLLEGTGFAAGLAAILGQLLWQRPYVISSGDAVTPFLGSKLPLATPLFYLYERMLYTFSTGFVGWTPYLVGRALTMGAGRAITVPGWAPAQLSTEERARLRRSARQELGIPEDAVVFGLAGSLSWSNRYQFCYGAELVRAATLCAQPPYVLIVGDGTGLAHLKQLAGAQLGRNIFLPGRVPKPDVMRYLAAMDVGSLPQSVDGVGSFRYTTKLPEYRNANLLIATNQIPMAYDLDRGDMLRLRGSSPWDPTFLDDLRNLMQDLTPAELAVQKSRIQLDNTFAREQQIARVTTFLSDLITSQAGRKGKRA